MPETPRTRDMIQHMLNALRTPSKELTKWEEGFLATVDDSFDRGYNLTSPQFETLERIYSEKTD